MTPAASAERRSKPQSKAKETEPIEPVWPAPLRPRPRLFIALMWVFVFWVGVLLWMYFTKNLPPARSPATKPTPALARHFLVEGQAIGPEHPAG